MSKFEFPPDMTHEAPDRVDPDTQVVAWKFEVGGKKAVRGFIQPGFEGKLPESEFGRQITLVNSPNEGTSLTIIELEDGQETDKVHPLTEDDEQVYIPAGRELSVTAGRRIVEYVSVYVGKPKKPASGKGKGNKAAKGVNKETAIIGEDLPSEIPRDREEALSKMLHDTFSGTSRNSPIKPRNRQRYGNRR